MCCQFIKARTTADGVVVLSIQQQRQPRKHNHNRCINYGSLESVSLEVCFVISSDLQCTRSKYMWIRRINSLRNQTIGCILQYDIQYIGAYMHASTCILAKNVFNSSSYTHSHLHPVQRLRMGAAKFLFLQIPLWHVQDHRLMYSHKPVSLPISY
jgi:hypothetical protein